jgi:hypothetical protein
MLRTRRPTNTIGRMVNGITSNISNVNFGDCTAM